MSRHYKQAHVWFHPWWHVVFLIHQNPSLAAICASNVLFSACVCRCSEWPEFFARTLYFLVAEKQRLRQSMLIQCLWENANTQVCHLEMAQGHDKACKRIHFSNVTRRIQLASFARSHYPWTWKRTSSATSETMPGPWSHIIRCKPYNVQQKISDESLLTSFSHPSSYQAQSVREQVHRLLDILEQPSTSGLREGQSLSLPAVEPSFQVVFVFCLSASGSQGRWARLGTGHIAAGVAHVKNWAAAQVPIRLS